MSERPKLVVLFLDSLKLDYSSGGIKRLIPYILLISVAVGFATAFSIPPDKTPDKIFPVIAALITAQGIILAMSMQTSGIILNNISQGDFNIYLKEHRLLDYYMLLVQLIQMIHVVSLFLLLTTAVTSLLDSLFIPYVFKTSLALSIGAFLYALRWAWGTSIIIRDLIHYRNEFEYNKAVKKLKEQYADEYQ